MVKSSIINKYNVFTKKASAIDLYFKAFYLLNPSILSDPLTADRWFFVKTKDCKKVCSLFNIIVSSTYTPFIKIQ